MALPLILQIVADGAAGGGTTVVLGLCQDLLASGRWRVVLVSQPDSYALQQAAALGIETIPFDFFTSRFDRGIPARLAAAIAAIEPPALIHVHGGRAAFPFCHEPLRNPAGPLLYTVHGYHFRLKTGPLKWLGWWAERRIARRCAMLSWVSDGDQRVARHWRLLPPTETPTAVVRNGIDPALFAGLAATEPTVDLIFAGRLEPPKNPLLMIDILACLKQRAPSLLLVGGGGLEPALRAYAKQKGVADLIHFTGALSHHATLAAIASAKIAVVPSRWEGFPVLPLEAGYLGLPVVAAAIPGIDEIVVDGETGFLLADYDPARYADAISVLLDSPERRQAMGAKARQRIAEHFPRQASSEQYMACYRQLTLSNPS